MKPNESPLDRAIRKAMAKRQPREFGGYLIPPCVRECVVALHSGGITCRLGRPK